MVVGVCRVSLWIEESQSLKDKRSVLRRIKDRVSQKFNCAIAEVGSLDELQDAELGFAVVSNERGFTQAMVQKILTFVDELGLGKVLDDEQDYVDYGDGALAGVSTEDYSHWEPEEPSPPGTASAKGRVIRPPSVVTEEDYPWDSPQGSEEKPAALRAQPPSPPTEADGGSR